MDTRVRYLLILAVYVAACVVVGTGVTVHLTDLNGADSFYYVVQTLWTVGFGDVIWGGSSRWPSTSSGPSACSRRSVSSAVSSWTGSSSASAGSRRTTPTGASASAPRFTSGRTRTEWSATGWRRRSSSMKSTDVELLRWSAVVAAFLAVSTAVFCHLEGWSVFDSFYYSFTTSTSAGFGDLVVSRENRVLAAVFMMVGATLVLSLAANVGQWIMDTVTRRRAVRAFRRELEATVANLRALGPDTSALERRLEAIVSEGVEAAEADDLDLGIGGHR